MLHNIKKKARKYEYIATMLGSGMIPLHGKRSGELMSPNFVFCKLYFIDSARGVRILVKGGAVTAGLLK
jgi:hypothetical protein